MSPIDRCCEPGCRDEAEVYKMGTGRGWCWKHWDRQCRLKDKKAEKLYAMYMQHKQKDPIERHIAECYDPVESHIIKKKREIEVSVWPLEYGVK